MFRSHAIILCTQIIRDNFLRVTLFSREYGKITCWSKKNIVGDIGSIVVVGIEKKGIENHIRTIDIVGSIDCIFSKYDDVYRFLLFMRMLYIFLPALSEQYNIYDDINEFLKKIKKYTDTQKEEHSTGNGQFIILMHIRVLKKLGILKSELFKGSTVLEYIYINIEKISIARMEKSHPIKSEILMSLEEIILATHHSFLYGI